MKKLILGAAVALALSGCISMVNYPGEDAVIIEQDCSVTATKEHYPSIWKFDDSIIKSPPSCSVSDRFPPGRHDLVFLPTIVQRDLNRQVSGKMEAKAVEFAPKARYVLSVSLEGDRLYSRIREKSSGALLVEASTPELRYSSNENAALKALPFIPR